MNATPRRLTRKERQAQTREELLISGARVIAERGLAQATIDEVVEQAGYTKGAFYANFQSKDDLFLAMLDEHFAAKTKQLEAIISSDVSDEEKARLVAGVFSEEILGDKQWQRLMLAFSTHAAQDEEFRRELQKRHREMRSRLAAAMQEQARAMGEAWPIPYEQIAQMASAMTHGSALEGLIAGEEASDQLLTTMLMIFFTGLRTLAS
ncbi:MAG: TetR/AcrR family transcriptional regulator [Solirubrobacterales bacterium]|nr:TetR/AcrR family transcriptional regulator [Solirubrobacterales bacterium]